MKSFQSLYLQHSSNLPSVRLLYYCMNLNLFHHFWIGRVRILFFSILLSVLFLVQFPVFFLNQIIHFINQASNLPSISPLKYFRRFRLNSIAISASIIGGKYFWNVCNLGSIEYTFDNVDKSNPETESFDWPSSERTATSCIDCVKKTVKCFAAWPRVFREAEENWIDLELWIIGYTSNNYIILLTLL